ncbi:MAG: hypothetical protein WBI82_08000 [Sphaerochaeta sp.]
MKKILLSIFLVSMVIVSLSAKESQVILMTDINSCNLDFLLSEGEIDSITGNVSMALSLGSIVKKEQNTETLMYVGLGLDEIFSASYGLLFSSSLQVGLTQYLALNSMLFGIESTLFSMQSILGSDSSTTEPQSIFTIPNVTFFVGNYADFLSPTMLGMKAKSRLGLLATITYAYSEGKTLYSMGMKMRIEMRGYEQ